MSVRHPLSALIPGFKPPADGRVRGVVIAGLDDPAFLDRVLGALPRLPDGYEAPVFIIDPREDVGVDASARVRVFTGDRCTEEFLAFLRGRLGLSLPKHIIAGSTDARRWAGELAQGLGALSQDQQKLDAAIRARLAARWNARGLDHWTRRYADLDAGADAARILILTSRYSTFVRHAANDLAAAFDDLGHEARILIEPDEHATLTTPFYLGAIEKLDPDLVVGINYPRAALGDALPDGWPYLCWIQDAMPHLFGAAATAPTPLDFIAGHVYPQAAQRAGYPADALLEHPVCVSTRKFHAGPVRESDAQRFACDVAYVSHRSETPQAFHERFVADASVHAHALDGVERCRASIQSIIEAWPTRSDVGALHEAAADLATAFGRANDARVADLLLHQYVLPLAEQTIRHETLEWAATIARDERLSLRIFGAGWSDHPTLAEYAGGPLDHGDELRACYQGAAVHLHASVQGVGHQRVWECALSGGLPLCRRSWHEVYLHDWAEAREFVTSETLPDVCFYRPRWPGHVVADHPALMRMIRRRQLVPPPPQGWDHDYLPGGLYAQIAFSETNRPFDAPIPAAHLRPIGVLGDPLELTFSTRDELRERLLRAAARSQWRASLSAGVAARVRQSITTERFARRVLEFVGAGIVRRAERERAA